MVKEKLQYLSGPTNELREKGLSLYAQNTAFHSHDPKTKPC